MDKNSKKKELALRSSAAEYLTFVASTGDSDESFEMRYEDENIWLTQKMMAALCRRISLAGRYRRKISAPKDREHELGRSYGG